MGSRKKERGGQETGEQDGQGLGPQRRWKPLAFCGSACFSLSRSGTRGLAGQQVPECHQVGGLGTQHQMSNLPGCSVLFWASFSGLGSSAEGTPETFPVQEWQRVSLERQASGRRGCGTVEAGKRTHESTGRRGGKAAAERSHRKGPILCHTCIAAGS